MESAQKLFSKMYEQTQGAQGQAVLDRIWATWAETLVPRAEMKQDTAMML